MRIRGDNPAQTRRDHEDSRERNATAMHASARSVSELGRRAVAVVQSRSTGDCRAGGTRSVRLRSSDGAHTLAAERTLEIDSHQRLDLTMDIPAPDADYAAEAFAVYPD